MSPTTQLQKPLGVVFGLLSVLKVQVMLAWASADESIWLSGDGAVAAAGGWDWCQKTSQRRAAFTAARRESTDWKPAKP